MVYQEAKQKRPWRRLCIKALDSWKLPHELTASKSFKAMPCSAGAEEGGEGSGVAVLNTYP